MRLYLAGPMSGYAQFNFPAFYAATDDLRARGWDIVSPAELDDEQTKADAMASANGNPQDTKRTWGYFLARDVNIVSDQVDGIVFLPDWVRSRGAKLEAFVALLCKGHQFFQYHGPDEPIEALSTGYVLHQIYMDML